VASKQLDTDTTAAVDGGTMVGSPHKEKETRWKRKARKERKAESKKGEERTTQGITLGAPRCRSNKEVIEEQPAAKRIVMHVPSLLDCLGEENLRVLKEQDKLDRSIGNILNVEAIEKEVDQGESVSLDIVADSRVDDVIGHRGDGDKQPEHPLQREAVTGEEEGIIGRKVNRKEPEPGSDGMKLGAKESAWQDK
jgi:hypothetical protein